MVRDRVRHWTADSPGLPATRCAQKSSSPTATPTANVHRPEPSFLKRQDAEVLCG